MSDLNKWAEENLWPKVWENADKIFPEFNFKRNNNCWVSQNGLKIDGSIGEKGKVYIYKDRPYYLKDYTRDGISITTYLKEKSEADSWIGSLKYLADKVGIHFPKSNIHKEIEMSKNKKESLSVKEAREIWENSKPIEVHAYLTTKRIRPHGIREYKNELVIPMCYKDEISSLQFIKENGDKKFLSGGKTAGCYFIIGNLEGAKKICIAEGWATGASIHQATNLPVYIAFYCGNLESVSQYVREQYPDREIIICADDDFKTEGNPGKAKAIEAAINTGAKVIFPLFKERPDYATDFNDMAKLSGPASVKSKITAAESPWSKPLPLFSTSESDDYPIEALPKKIRNAVEEVIGYVQAPIPLAASSALGALSIVIQAHINVKRDTGLCGPCNLFLLTVAESGERKTKCDSYFTEEIKKYNNEQNEKMKSELKQHHVALESWDTEMNGIKSQLKFLAKNGKSTEDIKTRLFQLGLKKPIKPMIPRLLYDDITPESLIKQLATIWPFCGILSNEGGTVLGSYGMNKESIVRNLAIYNKLWDGNDVTIDRKSSNSLIVSNPRLTISLQIQPVTLEKFLAENNGLARGIGFWSRCLIAWPKSTQGERLYKSPPSNWASLQVFNKQIRDILEADLPYEDGKFSFKMLSFSSEAQKAWIKFHDEIEIGLKESKEFSDIASKLAEQAARLALLFQAFEHGFDSPISLDSFDRAAKIMRWHFAEAKRFFRTLELSQEEKDIIKLNDWLVKYCLKNQVNHISKRDIQRNGHQRFRDKGDILGLSLERLESLNRMAYVKEGKQTRIVINPLLLDG